MACRDGTCVDTALCPGCLGREYMAKRAQARVAGECWAERICRGDRRARQHWPAETPKIRAAAERQVAQLAPDPRLLAELVPVCLAGAAAWWERRPVRYRVDLERVVG